MATLKFYPGKIKQLDRVTRRALELTGDAVLTEVKNAEVMPFDTGTMQNENTFLDTSNSSRGNVSIVVTSPQARRLYFHPEYNFQTIENGFAGAGWFEPWQKGGANAEFVHKAFSMFLKKGI